MRHGFGAAGNQTLTVDESLRRDVERVLGKTMVPVCPGVRGTGDISSGSRSASLSRTGALFAPDSRLWAARSPGCEEEAWAGELGDGALTALALSIFMAEHDHSEASRQALLAVARDNRTNFLIKFRSSVRRCG